MRQITILGATGSIGRSTLAVIALHPNRFSLYALTANRDVDGLFAQCMKFRPKYAAMADSECAKRLAQKLSDAGAKTKVFDGEDAMAQLASSEAVDTVVCGIVGAIGLLPTLAAVRSGKMVLIANKEPLVMLGAEIMTEAQQNNATILPIDSEHNAIYQCVPNNGDQQASQNLKNSGVEKILLTGSGGPFRQLDKTAFAAITPAQACAHPNWEMGQKISVDSATMMNKGLELIEACALFDVPADFVQIVVHPQSVIHSMVQYIDGSVLAQLGAPDMRTPIAHALAYPDRIESGVARLALFDLAHFDFEPPDEDKFPSLSLAKFAAETGGTLPTILNAANEVAVAAFLGKRLAFDQIPDLIKKTMDALPYLSERCLETVLAVDAEARQIAKQLL